MFAFSVPAFGIGMVFLSKPSRRVKRWVVIVGVLALIALLLAGCGGATATVPSPATGTGPSPGPGPLPSPGPTPSTVAVQVSATSGAIQHSTTVSLNLQ
jgi:hypothetical protein